VNRADDLTNEIRYLTTLRSLSVKRAHQRARTFPLRHRR